MNFFTCKPCNSGNFDATLQKYYFHERTLARFENIFEQKYSSILRILEIWSIHEFYWIAVALFLFSSIKLFFRTNRKSSSTSKIAAEEERKWRRGWRNKMKEEIWTIYPPIHSNWLSRKVFIDASLIKRHFPSKKSEFAPKPACTV